jgi:hypothetical protein
LKIYQTNDIESAIRRMNERNEWSIVFQNSFCRRSVRERLEKVADIPSILVRPWDLFAEKSIEKWQAEKGLMYYRNLRRKDLMPETDALIFTCCPLHEKELFQFQGRVRKELIIYRPPDWSMHDEEIEFKHPDSSVYRKIVDALDVVKNDELTKNQFLAFQYSDFYGKEASIFSQPRIESIAGIKRGQFNLALRGKWFMKGRYHRYNIYQLMVAPMEPDLLEMYRILEEEEDVEGGLRILRFGKLKRGYVKFFEKALKILVKSKCVAEYEPVHIVLSGFKPMDYEIQDAVSAVKREGCYRLRKMVNESPIYQGG